MQREIKNTNEIQSFFHCGSCMGQKPEHTSPRDWSQLEVGYTVLGIQVWCKRCECNILHMDFQGQKHPANLSTDQAELLH